MKTTIRACAELVRPPALCTSAADSWAGIACMLVVTQHTMTLAQTLYVQLFAFFISMCVYAGGMVCNDIFDYQIDLIERPQRPITSQRIPMWGAVSFALLLQSMALFFALWIHVFVFYATAITILATYAYNYVFKSTLIAPLMMGLCRGANFWIGISIAYVYYCQSLSHTDVKSLFEYTQSTSMISIMTAGSITYVTTLTMLSTYEVEGGVIAQRRSKLLCSLLLLPLVYWGLGFINLWAYLSIGVAWVVAQSMRPLWEDEMGSAHHVRKAVMAGIKGVALLNAVLCMGFGFYQYAVVLIILTFCAKYVAQWFYAT